MEADIFPPRPPRRAARPAVDAGGAHAEHEAAVEARVAFADGLPAAFGVGVVHGKLRFCGESEGIFGAARAAGNPHRVFKLAARVRLILWGDPPGNAPSGREAFAG
ncbi:hypothetical protein D9M68_857710 [compost metagenome]